MSDETNRQLRKRRDLLKTGLVGGSMLLAGCGANRENSTPTPSGGGMDEDGGTGTDSSGGSSGGAVRFELGMQPGRQDFEQMHYNPYDPDNQMNSLDPAGILYDPPVFFYVTGGGEHEPYMLSDYSLNGDVLEVQFRDDWYWHDGDNVTAQDYTTQWNLDLELQRIQSGEEHPHPWVRSVEALDEYSMRFTLHEAYDELFAVYGSIGSGLLTVKSDLGGDPRTYQEWYEALRDAEGDEAETLVTELFEWQQPEPVGNGPFQVREVQPDTVITEKFADHPFADQIAVDEYVFQQYEDIIVAFMEGEADALLRNLPAPSDIASQLPEYQQINHGSIESEGLCLNMGDYDSPYSDAPQGAYEPYTRDLEVRQAITYLVDKERIISTISDVNEAYSWPPSFLPPSSHQNNAFDMSGFEGYEPNPERATQLLEEAGYTKDGDTWVDEEGNPMEMRCLTLSGHETGLPMIQTVVDTLNEFGIPAQLDAVDGATFSDRRFAGEFDILYDGNSLESVLVRWGSTDNWEWLCGLHHSDDTYEVPMPVGDPEGSEGTGEINVSNEITSWALSGDDSHIRRIAWVINQALPRYNLTYRVYGGGVQTGDWSVSGPERVLKNRPAEKNILKHSEASLQPK